MKAVKNNSLQSFTIYFNTEKGCKEVWMIPGKTLVVHDTYISEQIKTLHRRRIFKISNA